MYCLEAAILIVLLIIVLMMFVEPDQFHNYMLTQAIINSLIGVMLLIAVFRIRSTIKS